MPRQRTPRKHATPPKRGQGRPAPRKRVQGIEGEVLPLQLGQAGMIAACGSKRFTVTAAVPGDRLRLRPLRAQRHAGPPSDATDARIEAAPAERLGVVAPGEQRTTAPCAVLAQCGGCSLQELHYPAQLAAKTEALRAALAPLGAEAAAVGEVVGMRQPYGHRTKLLMPASGRGGRLRFGFYERGTLRLVAAEGCPVQHPLTLALLAMVTQALDAYNVTPSSDPDGWLHALGIRVDPRSGAGEVVLVGRDRRLPGGQRLQQQLAELPGVNALYLNVNPTRSSYPLSDTFIHLAGSKRTPFSLAEQRFLLSPGTFFQTSAEAAEQLALQVREALPDRIDCLADIYGGAGIFARLAATRWRRAVVAEANPSAVADLRLALEHEPARLTVVAGRVEHRLRQLATLNPDVVLLDPPRRGCHPKVIEAVANWQPCCVVYVACSIDALLADSRRLLDAGYRLVGTTAVDMFPHTAHLEIVARYALC